MSGTTGASTTSPDTVRLNVLKAYLDPLLAKHHSKILLTWEDLQSSKRAADAVLQEAAVAAPAGEAANDNTSATVAPVQTELEALHKEQLRAYMTAAETALKTWLVAQLPAPKDSELEAGRDQWKPYAQRCMKHTAQMAGQRPNYKVGPQFWKKLVTETVSKQSRAAFLKASAAFNAASAKQQQASSEPPQQQQQHGESTMAAMDEDKPAEPVEDDDEDDEEDGEVGENEAAAAAENEQDEDEEGAIAEGDDAPGDEEEGEVEEGEEGEEEEGGEDATAEENAEEEEGEMEDTTASTAGGAGNVQMVEKLMALKNKAKAGAAKAAAKPKGGGGAAKAKKTVKRKLPAKALGGSNNKQAATARSKATRGRGRAAK